MSTQAKLDAGIVIPSYDEGVDVVHTLASIARQRDLENRNVGVFVVINQARNAAHEVSKSNAQTAELVRSLKRGAMPDGLSEETRKIIFPARAEAIYGPAGEVVISLRKAAEQVLACGLNIEEINLWEGENAPLNCNVGIARHRGTVEAMRALKNKQCAILGSDADAIFAIDRVKKVINLFEEDPLLMAICGNLHIFQSSDRSNLKLLSASFLNSFNTMFDDLDDTLFELMTRGTADFSETGRVRGDNNEKLDPQFTFDGINMNFRACLYDTIKFRPIAGEEDTEFGHAILRDGHKFEHHGDKVATATLERISTRATTGMGQNLVNDVLPFAEHPDDFPVAGLKAVKLKVAIVKALGRELRESIGNEQRAIKLVKQKYRDLINLGLDPSEILHLATHLSLAESWEEFSFQMSVICIANRPSTLVEAFEDTLNFLEKFQHKTARPADRTKIRNLIEMIKAQRENLNLIKRLLELESNSEKPSKRPSP